MIYGKTLITKFLQAFMWPERQNRFWLIFIAAMSLFTSSGLFIIIFFSLNKVLDDKQIFTVPATCFKPVRKLYVHHEFLKECVAYKRKLYHCIYICCTLINVKYRKFVYGLIGFVFIIAFIE